MIPPAISVESLSVTRGGRPVLHELGFQVPAGQVTGLLGPSGCGKSTLLRSIVGVQRITDGRVTVLGQAAGSAGLRRRIGYVTQDPSVYGDLSVTENLQFFARVLDVSRARVDELIDLVALDSQRDQVVDRLSGGQRSRVSLAVALLGDPELVVLDEPTVGLDPVLRAELWQRFRELAEGGVTLLVSSHVMDEASRCDRLLLMRQGRIIADDTPSALLERTHTRDIESAFLALVAP